MTHRERNSRALFSLGLFIFVASFLALAGCDEKAVGWDPATMRCREWQDAIPVGPFLKDEDCAGKPRPVELQPEQQGLISPWPAQRFLVAMFGPPKGD